MAKRAALLSLIAIIAVAAVAVGVHADNDQREFDFWTFAMHWAPSVCLGTTACCNRNACCRSNAPNKFVIQGLWPDYNDLTYPTFCDCDTKKFDLSKIASLIPRLEDDWAFLSCNKSQLCSGTTKMDWASVWEKHGSCGNLDQYGYFYKALQLYDKFNPMEIFIKAGINPSNNQLYRFREVVEAINNSVGAASTIDCENGFIKGVRLCFSKDFGQPQDCDHTGHVCPKYVKIPVYGPITLDAEL